MVDDRLTPSLSDVVSLTLSDSGNAIDCLKS